MTKIITLTEDTFEEEIKSEVPVLVDFWAEWCGPCRLIGPVLEELSEELDTMKIAKLNVDDHPAPSGQHSVLSIPTMILFKDGVEQKRIVGAVGKASIMREFSEFL